MSSSHEHAISRKVWLFGMLNGVTSVDANAAGGTSAPSGGATLSAVGSEILVGLFGRTRPDFVSVIPCRPNRSRMLRRVPLALLELRRESLTELICRDTLDDCLRKLPSKDDTRC